jgi:hypothetical protein
VRIKLKIGDDNHIKGFILNKLFILRCFSREGKHNKHIPEQNVPKNYDRKFRGKFKKNIKELKKEGIIYRFRAKTGRDTSYHICFEISKLKDCRPIINAYRRSVGLRPLNNKFE